MNNPNVSFRLIFVLFWSGFTLLFDAKFVRDGYRQLQAIYYPQTRGVVVESAIHTNHDSESTTYCPYVRYTYSLGDRHYTNDRYRYGDMGTQGDRSQRIVDAFPAGKQIDVHYRATDPADSVLLVGLEGMDLWGMLFMTPFNIVMLVGWAWVGSAMRSRSSPPVPPGVPVWCESGTLRVRLVQFSPLLVFAGTLGITAFISIFVVGAFFSASPSLAVMGATWGAVLALSLLAYEWQRERMAAGIKDLVIDSVGGTITLPLGYGRKQSVVVALRDVLTAGVKAIESTNSDGGRLVRYAATLLLSEPDGTQRTEKIWESFSRERVAMLVQWLEEQLNLKSSPEHSSDSKLARDD